MRDKVTPMPPGPLRHSGDGRTKESFTEFQ